MIGIVFGWTTPSVSGVDVIGDASADTAVNVDFDGVSGWFTPDLLELVDHGAGATVKIADQSFVRTESGEWLPDAAPDPDRGTEP